MDAIRRRLSGQSRVPLGVHLWVCRRRRLLLRLDRATSVARGRLGGEAELFSQSNQDRAEVIQTVGDAMTRGRSGAH